MRQSVPILLVAVATLSCGDRAPHVATQHLNPVPSQDEAYWRGVAERAKANGLAIGIEISGAGYQGVILTCEEESEGCWTPTKDEVAQFETALASFRRKNIRTDFPSLEEYRRHYEGVTRDGRLLIRTLFFHDSTGFVRSGAWRTVPTRFMGGGDKFLTGLYDATAREVLSVNSNAPM